MMFPSDMNPQWEKYKKKWISKISPYISNMIDTHIERFLAANKITCEVRLIFGNGTWVLSGDFKEYPLSDDLYTGGDELYELIEEWSYCIGYDDPFPCEYVGKYCG